MKTDVFRDIYQAEFQAQTRQAEKSQTGRMTFDEKFVYPSKPPSTATEIRQRQLEAMRRQHNALLSTLNDTRLHTYVGRLMADMERKTVDAMLNGVMGGAPAVKEDKPVVKADYAETEFRVMAHMKDTGEVTFPIAVDLEVIVPSATDHFPNGSSRHDVLNGKAAPTDFCSFYNSTGLRDCIMASDIGRAEAPRHRKRGKSGPRR